MKDLPSTEKIIESLKEQSKYIAIVVRNAMEDFHSKNLSDDQMKELNPIIRNAIYTALYSLMFSNDSDRAKQFISYNSAMIPNYWEEPQLLAELS